MPSKSPEQHRLMEAVAHGWRKPGGGGPPASVAKEFVAADKAKGMADGGRVDTPAEGMPAVQHVHEQDDHFIVTFADGTSTTVLKKGLKKDTLAHIQGMAHGGLVIAGGGVRIESEGSSPGEENDAPAEVHEDKEPGNPIPVIHKPAVTPTEESGVPEVERDRVEGFARGGEVPPMLAAPDPNAPVWDPAGWQAIAANPPIPPAPSLEDQYGDLPDKPSPGQVLKQYADPTAHAPGSELWARLNNPQGVLATPPGFEPKALPGPPAPTLDQDAQAAAEATAKAMQRQPQTPTGPTAPGASLPSGRTAGGGALTELDKGLAEQRAGLTAQVEAEKARDAALLKLQDEQLAQRQSLEARQATEWAAHQKRADDLFMAVQSGKVDPRRVWANADVGQKIGAGIGIILSGIGQGLAGGPNMAMQVIDRTIDRDIDAQKTNLENQKGLLSYYLQQGRDMLSAHQLAKADLKDMFAAQLLRVSAEFGGQDAAARAQLVGGQLRTEAAGKRQEIIARGMQIEQARMAMEQQMAVRRLMTSGTMHPAMAALIGGGPEKLAEHMVQVPRDVADKAGLPHQVMETRYVFPGLKAEKAADAVMENRLITEKVKRLHAFVAAHPYGTLSPQDSQAAHDLVADLSLSWNKSQENLNRLNEREAEMIQGMIKDPSELHVSGRYAQSVNDLLAAVQAKRRAVEDQYLIPQ